MYNYHTALYDKEFNLIKVIQSSFESGGEYWNKFIIEFNKNPNVFNEYYVIIYCSGHNFRWCAQRYNIDDYQSISQIKLDYDKVDKEKYAILDKEYLKNNLKKIGA